MGDSTRHVKATPIASDQDAGADAEALHLRRTLILAVVALIMVLVAALVGVSSGTLQRWLTGWVDPGA
jgi:ABC-type microcin C transport system permease subunit YejE